MNHYKYFVINCFFGDWKKYIPKYTKISHVESSKYIANIPDNKIILLDLRDRNLYKYYSRRTIFKMNIENVILLDNKCLFAKFMMDNFPENIPTTISIKTDTINYVNSGYSDNSNRKMIKKDAVGYAGNSVSIVYNLGMRKNNTVVSDYINHTEYYSGHFLIYKGTLLKQIFFKGQNKDNPNLIRKGPITEYEVVEADKMKADVTFFEKLFKMIDYSGFACPEFTIVDGKVLLFEINPRPGGSLIANQKYCGEFFQTIIDMQLDD